MPTWLENDLRIDALRGSIASPWHDKHFETSLLLKLKTDDDSLRKRMQLFRRCMDMDYVLLFLGTLETIILDNSFLKQRKVLSKTTEDVDVQQCTSLSESDLGVSEATGTSSLALQSVTFRSSLCCNRRL